MKNEAQVELQKQKLNNGLLPNAFSVWMASQCKHLLYLTELLLQRDWELSVINIRTALSLIKDLMVLLKRFLLLRLSGVSLKLCNYVFLV